MTPATIAIHEGAAIVSLTSFSAAVAAVAEGGDAEGVLNFAIPLMCVAGSIIGGFCSVAFFSREDEARAMSPRLLAFYWLTNSAVAIMFGPWLCECLPMVGMKITGASALGLSGLLGLTATSLITWINSRTPYFLDRFSGAKCDTRGPKE